MKQLLTIALLALSFAGSALAQQADRWKGLILDESTPEQAIETLGKAKSDTPKFDKYVKYLVKNEPKTNIRSLHWEKTAGFKDVRLIFHQNKLIVISLQQPQTALSVGDVTKAYGDLSFDVSSTPGLFGPV